MKPLAPLLFFAVLLPASVFALDFTDLSIRYTDSPFSKPEAIAVSLLTRQGVVQGNPNGTFGIRQNLNRAEFVKIALLSKPSLLEPESARVTRGCFPDVPVGVWFTRYVCTAKRLGIVQGYTNGKFHPERNVTYAEALKIVAEVHGYAIGELRPGEQWYMPYVRAAAERKVLLPISVGYDEFLLRGEMARLAAAAIAESHGELAAYRSAEQGQLSSSSSSVSAAASSVSKQSSVSSMSSVTSLSASSSVSVSADFPIRSHFLRLGVRSRAIAGGEFSRSDEAVRVRVAKVKLRREVNSFESLVVFDSAGRDIGTLYLDPTDATHRTWRGEFSLSGTYVIPRDTPRTIGLAGILKPVGAGTPNELVQVDTFSLTLQGVDSGQSFDASSALFAFPEHQTTQSVITSVRNVLPERQAFSIAGSNQLLGAFVVNGTISAGGSLHVAGLDFKVTKSPSVAVSQWQLGVDQSPTRVDCSAGEGVVSCLNIPQEIGIIPSDGRTFRVYGNVAVDQGGVAPSLRLTIDQPGTIGVIGAIRWTDGSATFTWVEASQPVAVGTLWQ